MWVNMYGGPGLVLVLVLLALVNRYGVPALVLVNRHGAAVLVRVSTALVNRYEVLALVLVLVLVLLALVNRSGAPALVLVLVAGVLESVEFYSKLLVYPSPPYRAQIENFALSLRSHLVLNGVSTFLKNLLNFVQNKLFFGFYLHIVHRYIYQPFAVPRK